jgi:hypothetical protein
MGAERIDITERGIACTSRGMTVLQQLANIRATVANPLEPWLCHSAQLANQASMVGSRRTAPEIMKSSLMAGECWLRTGA